MEDVASSSGGHPSALLSASSSTSSSAQLSIDAQSPTNHRRRYTGSSIPLRPDGPIQPVLSNGFVPIAAPSIIGPGGFESVDRFRSNLGYPSQYSGGSVQNQRQGRSAGLRHSSPHNHQRRQSRSSDRDVFQPEIGGFLNASWSSNNSTRLANSSLAPRHSIANLQSNNRSEAMLPAQPPSSRPQYRSQRSSYTMSNSVPSTPRHPRTRHDAGKSRSPSPTPFTLDSPRSAASDPSTHPVIRSRCQYESGLVLQRRRIPYSIGSDPLPEEKPSKTSLSAQDEEKLTADLEKLYSELLPSDESNERRRKFLEKLEKLLNDEWPGHQIKVRPFGSTENRLCSTDSDVDVCIVTDFKDLENVCLLAKTLGKHHMERIVCVQNAKVPIVRIWDPEYKVQCDMNVNNTLALENTRMVKTYVDIDPRVQPLAMIIKHWTKHRILNDAAGGGTLSSYTWICMIVNFLQTREPPILPSLHQREHKKRPPQHGVDVSFDDDIETLRGFGKANTESLGSLLFNFFKRYGYEIDFEKSVVSIRMGKLISKAEKKWDALFGNRLCVEEPFSIARNLSNGADDNAVRGIHEEFRRAFKLLAETPPNLTAWCEEYVFPKEELPSASDFVKPASRPIQITRSNSASKGRSTETGRSRNRQFNSYGNGRNSTYNSRRASSGAAITNTNLPMTTPLMSVPGAYALVANHDGTFPYNMLETLPKHLLEVQHAHRQNMIARHNLLNTFAQASAAAQSMNHQANNQIDAAQKQQQQVQSNLLAAQAQLQMLPHGYPAFMHFPPYLCLPNSMGDYSANIALAAGIPQTSLDQRLNRTKNLQPGGPRSRSQPAPHIEPGVRQTPNVVHSESIADSQDLGASESIATASSTSEQPHTPSELHTGEDSFGEYYGYLYPDQHTTVSASSDQSTSQKSAGERQRQTSKEKMVPPKFSDHRRPSQPPSPITTANHSKFAQNQDAIWSSSEGDGERSISQDSFDEEPRQRGPVIVNGSASSVPVTPPFDNDDSPQLSLHGDSPHEEIMYHNPTSFSDTYGASLLDHSHQHGSYGQPAMNDDMSGIPKGGYAINPFSMYTMQFPQFLQLQQAYPSVPVSNFDLHTGQKLRHRQAMQQQQQQYGRQHDAEQTASMLRNADQRQVHPELTTSNNTQPVRETKQASQHKERQGAGNGGNDAQMNPKQAGNASGPAWRNPSPKNGSGKKAKPSGSEADNSSEDGNTIAKQAGQTSQSSRSGTVRAKSVVDAIQVLTKSTGPAGQSSATHNSKSSATSSTSTKPEDSPTPTNQSQSNTHSKSKEWNKNSHKRKGGNKKKRAAATTAATTNTDTTSATGDDRKGG
ncbi:hypothetical protein TWF730_003292 [Orbilia blumenaviensis]|uniref:polynucleotide adenylyltransferase n=1 Tax=Orbilia blumenaviensis TaxID=1796055 RepID=A0AAV9U5I5_9PEZI